MPALPELAERGMVRYIDIVLITKDKQGHTQAIERNDLEPRLYKAFVPPGKHVSSLFTMDDLEFAARDLKKNTSARLLLWENLWTINFRKAALKANGRLAARGQIAPAVLGQFKKELAAKEKKQAAAKKRAAAKKATSNQTSELKRSTVSNATYHFSRMHGALAIPARHGCRANHIGKGFGKSWERK